MKSVTTEWFPEYSLIVTRLNGNINELDVDAWEQSLKKALSQIPDNSTFKILIDLHGFEAANIAVHKKFRIIIPLTLAEFGWKVGYVDLFEEGRTLKIATCRGIKCLYAAHVHHDATKIEKYEQSFGRANEHFFTDSQKAEAWINTVS